MYFVVCAYCLNINDLNLIPCGGCNHTMYCSTECQQKASAEYHDLECKMLDSLIGSACLFGVHAFFKSLWICDGNIDELQQLINSVDDNSPRLTIFDCDYANLSDNELKRKLILVAYSGIRDSQNRSGYMGIVEELMQNSPKTSAMMMTHGKFILKFIDRLLQIEEINAVQICKKLPKDGKLVHLMMGM